MGKLRVTEVESAVLVDGKGDALSPLTLSATVAGFVALEPGFKRAKLYCASPWKLLLCPALRVCAFKSGTTYTDYRASVTDKSDSTHMPLDGMTTAQTLYLATPTIMGGVYVDVGSNVNAEAGSALAVKFYNGSAFADVVGDSDLTAGGGITLTKDGLYSWTVPASDPVTGSTLGLSGLPHLDEPLHWISIAPSITLTGETVDINELIPMSRHETYMVMQGGQEYEIPIDPEQVGGIQVLSVSGGPALYIDWIKAKA